MHIYFSPFICFLLLKALWIFRCELLVEVSVSGVVAWGFCAKTWWCNFFGVVVGGEVVVWGEYTQYFCFFKLKPNRFWYLKHNHKNRFLIFLLLHNWLWVVYLFDLLYIVMYIPPITVGYIQTMTACLIFYFSHINQTINWL